MTGSTAETPRVRRGFLTRSFSVAVVAKAYGEPGRQLGGSGIDTAAAHWCVVMLNAIHHDTSAGRVMRWCAVSGLPEGGRLPPHGGRGGPSCMNGHPSRVLAALAPAHEEWGAWPTRKNDPRDESTRARAKEEEAPHRVEGGGAMVAAIATGHAVAAQSRRCLTLPFPQSQTIAHNGHRCPVCAPRKRVLDPGSTFPPVARMAVSLPPPHAPSMIFGQQLALSLCGGLTARLPVERGFAVTHRSPPRSERSLELDPVPYVV